MIADASGDRLWGALADPTRRRILDLLRERPRTTGELSALFPQSRYAVMKHLTVLESAGLLVVRRAGRDRWNSINATPLQWMYERWLTPYARYWASSLARLDALVQKEQSVMSDTLALPIRRIIIEQVIEIAAAPPIVFAALTERVARWWPHVTYESTRPDIRIEGWTGGRFVEICGDRQRLYAIVTRYEPGQRLWLQGAMGMSGCVFGTVEIELTPAGAATELRLSHQALGDLDDDDAASYRAGWTTVLAQRLRAHAEHGTDFYNAAISR